MHDDLLSKIKVEISSILPSNATALLFGSRARGTNREDSDWDILILLDRKGNSSWNDYDTIGYPVNMVFWQHNQDVNTIIQTREEWKQKCFTPFYKNVMNDAKVFCLR